MEHYFTQKYVTNKVLSPGGAEVVTTAILQRRQSYTQHGDQTQDTVTCSTSQHLTHQQPPATQPSDRRDCETYTGPAPSFLRLNSVQPFTLVFPVTDPRLANLSVQEVIDCLSEQLTPVLMYSLRGVRLVGGSCYLSFSSQQDADSVLSTTLKLRAVLIHLEDASKGSTIISLSGVPHDMADEAVASVLSHFGALVGPVERRLYKGVDTGERLVRMRAKLTIPRWIWLDGCRVCLKVLKNDELSSQNMTRRKSFRSHINVQLKPIVDDPSNPPTAPPTESSSSTPYTTPPPRTTLSNTNPFLCGSVPTIPIITNPAEGQPLFMSNASASTPNIFQDPFLFPSPFHSGEPPGLRRINSVMGTMSLRGNSPDTQNRSASSPPTGATLSVRNDEISTSVPPSPNTPRKSTRKSARKISKMSTDSRKTNGETSSSDQDSPNKPGRRRPSSVNFKQKPILNRNVSIDHDGTCLSGYEATCSERERSNSDLSSRQSICKRKLSTTGRESGKVPWCGCWGNGCL